MTSRDIATRIISCLHEAGHEAYLVGGCVRDELRGVVPVDYDIATSARPEEVEKLFPKTVGVGKSFGVMLVVENGTKRLTVDKNARLLVLLKTFLLSIVNDSRIQAIIIK